MDTLYNILSESASAFAVNRSLSPYVRAAFLRAVADQIDSISDELVETCAHETHLPVGRLDAERLRTSNQWRMFAALLEEGSWVEAIIDTALPDRLPVPRPDVRSMLVPLGPVLVFGASNFPLAFSTAGGDTASALAAGCSVVYKAHPAHPKTSSMMAAAIMRATSETTMPEGIFHHVEGGAETGQHLAKHPMVKAIAFTGSFQGGMALFKTASEREHPIPVYAEMGSVNPIIILSGRLKEGASELADSLSQSVMLGCGQFCTNPGLVFLPDTCEGDQFLSSLKEALSKGMAGKMLHEGIAKAYRASLDALWSIPDLDILVYQTSENLFGAPALAATTIRNWIENPTLHKEVFGPFTLVVRYSHVEQLNQVLNALEGQLTISLHGSGDELASLESLVSLAAEKCGRLLFSGVPTGVEVCHAMTHGGPFPATTNSRTTSVGTGAIKRFVRPVTYQSAPQQLLPEALKDNNPLSIRRLVNGVFTTESIR